MNRVPITEPPMLEALVRPLGTENAIRFSFIVAVTAPVAPCSARASSASVRAGSTTR